MSKILQSVLIICPRDLLGAAPYLRAASYAGVLEQYGHKVRIIEPAAEKMSLADIVAIIRSFRPEFVLIGVFPSNLPNAYQTIKQIKNLFPAIRIIAEGYMINANPDFIEHLGADWGLTGDAEFSLLELIKQLTGSGLDRHSIDGLIWTEGALCKWNKPALIKHLDDLPLPSYTLMPIGKYYSASTNKIFFTIFTARGCPYECNFCANISQAVFRYHSVERVIVEIDYLINKCGVEYLEFMDLTFTVNKKRTMEICLAIIEKGLVFDWACETRVDKVDEDLLQTMRKAGCSKITFGVESGAEMVRAKTQKTITNKEFIEVFDMCRRIGIRTMANFIFGHPQETLAEMENTITFSQQLNPFNVLFTKMIPLPDVSIFDIAVKEEVITHDIWARYMKQEVPIPVYTPQGISMAQLNRIYTRAHLRFYLRPKVLLQYLPLFTDLNFAYKSLFAFLGMTFGSTKYK